MLISDRSSTTETVRQIHEHVRDVRISVFVERVVRRDLLRQEPNPRGSCRGEPHSSLMLVCRSEDEPTSNQHLDLGVVRGLRCGSSRQCILLRGDRQPELRVDTGSKQAHDGRTLHGVALPPADPRLMDLVQRRQSTMRPEERDRPILGPDSACRLSFDAVRRLHRDRLEPGCRGGDQRGLRRGS